MIVLDRHTGATKGYINPSDYTVNLDSELSATSSFLIGQNSFSNGDIVVEDGYFGIIKSKPADSIECESLYQLFARRVLKPTVINTDFEHDLGTRMGIFISDADPMYNYPYFNITATSATSGTPAYKADSDGTISILELMVEYFKKYGIVTTFSLVTGGINISIGTAIFKPKILDLSRLDITSEEIQGDIVAKITTKNGNTMHNYYYLSNGTYGTNKSATNRVDGEWKTLFGTSDADLLKSVADEFANNKFKHLIEFTAPGEIFGQQLSLYDLVKVKGRYGDIYESYISALSKTKNSKLVTYKLGDLRVTLTDKLRRL